MTEHIYRFSFPFFVINLVLLSQSARLFSFLGIVPNIILIGGMFLICFEGNTGKVFDKILLIIIVGLLMIMWFPFWKLSALIMVCCLGAGAILKKKLTGNHSADFFICLVIGSIIFFAGNALFSDGGFNMILLVKEIAVNVVVGILLLILFAVLSHLRKNIAYSVQRIG